MLSTFLKNQVCKVSERFCYRKSKTSNFVTHFPRGPGSTFLTSVTCCLALYALVLGSHVVYCPRWVCTAVGGSCITVPKFEAAKEVGTAYEAGPTPNRPEWHGTACSRWDWHAPRDRNGACRTLLMKRWAGEGTKFDADAGTYCSFEIHQYYAYRIGLPVRGTNNRGTNRRGTNKEGYQ